MMTCNMVTISHALVPTVDVDWTNITSISKTAVTLQVLKSDSDFKYKIISLKKNFIFSY